MDFLFSDYKLYILLWNSILHKDSIAYYLTVTSLLYTQYVISVKWLREVIEEIVINHWR